MEHDVKALLARLAQLEAENSRLRKALDGTESPAPAEVTKSSRQKRGLQRSIRDQVVDALTDIGVMINARLLRLFVGACYDRDIPPTRFSGLSAEEQRAHVQGKTRTVWLCHGITTERFEPMARMWALSSWPLAERLIAPTTGRVNHLRLTDRICEIARKADGVAHSDKLSFIAADLAGSLPGVKIRAGEFPFQEWQSIARDLLEIYIAEDQNEREKAARLLQERSEHQRMFGVPELYQVPGGPGRQWGRQ